MRAIYQLGRPTTKRTLPQNHDLLNLISLVTLPSSSSSSERWLYTRYSSSLSLAHKWSCSCIYISPSLLRLVTPIQYIPISMFFYKVDFTLFLTLYLIIIFQIRITFGMELGIRKVNFLSSTRLLEMDLNFRNIFNVAICLSFFTAEKEYNSEQKCIF